MNQQTYKNALPNDYELHWYKIEQVLGQGAFGMTYLAHDKNLDRQVAIKEYLPGQLSHRNSDLTIQPMSSEHEEDFGCGLKRFISEARTLTKFVHPNLVSVFNVFEMNNTAYMVMNYETGKDLQRILKGRKTLREDELMKILMPLLGGLEVMHEKGFIHRDIKPGNIFIRKDGSPVLLDFGSARQTRNPRDGGNIEPQTLTNFVSPGYAPIEQYTGKSDRQGPWTDIYGMGATLYKAVTGEMPLAAIDRSETIVHDGKDSYISVTKMTEGNYSDRFLSAIDHALAFKIQDRPQTIAAWQNEFDISQDDIETTPVTESKMEDKGDVATVKIEQQAEETIQLSEAVEEATKKIASDDKTVPITPQGTTSSTGNRKLLIGGVAASLLIIIGMVFLISDDDKTPVKKEPAVVVHELLPEVIEESPQEIYEPEETMIEEVVESEDQQNIQELLALAEEDIKALRLMSPKDNNAFDKYLAILKIDENNEEAKQGIQLVSDKYISLAYRAIETNKLNQAKKYLRKAGTIQPDSEKLLTAQQTLQAKYEEQEKTGLASESIEDPQTATVTEDEKEDEKEDEEESSGGLWGDVKKWAKETAEKSEAANKEDTTSEKVIKTLGGN